MIHLTSAQYEALKLKAGQRDDLMKALVRAEQKLSAYVGICGGDKELTGAVLPMARKAIDLAIAEAA